MPHASLFLPDVTITNERTLADVSKEYPALAKVLARAALIPQSRPLDYLLCEQFGLTPPFALAHYTAGVDLGLVAAPDLTRCDPVYLHADPNKVLLIGPDQLDLTAAEADQLLARLNHEFPAQAWCRGASPTRWYLRRPPSVLADGPPTRWLSGRSLTAFLPSDPEHRELRRWLNDIQMVLHDAPANQARVARGVRPVNGTWLFGEGVAPTPRPVPCYAIGNDVLLAGLARAQAEHVYRMPAADGIKACGERNLVLVVDNGFGIADPARLGVTMDELNRDWIPALVTAVRRRQFETLNFHTANYSARLSWASSWRMWQKPVTFEITH